MKFKKWTSILISAMFFTSFSNVDIVKAATTISSSTDVIQTTEIQENNGNGIDLASSVQKATTTYTNPMYKDLVEYPSDSSTTVTSVSAISGVAAQTFTTVQEASDFMRQEMVKRSSNISFTLDKAYDQGLPLEMFKLAIAERVGGSSSEGDYLYSNFTGYNCSISYASNSNMFKVTYAMSYLSTYEEEQKVNTEVKNVLNSLNVYNSDEYTKIKAVHDYIVKNIKYDYSLEKYSTYNAIIEKNVVCQGFASLTYKMLKELGIGVRYITGIGNGGGHAWDIISIDGKWYNIDTTWDENISNYTISYHYFLKSNTDFTGHTRDDEYNNTSFNESYSMDKYSYVYYPTIVTLVDGIEWSYKVNAFGNAFNVMPVQNLGVVDKVETLSSITIPDELDGKKVVSIGENVFRDCVSLTSINIPEGITDIKDNTFANCTSLKIISIPSSVTNIDANAFRSCAKLTSIYANSGSFASSYNWLYGKVDAVTGYTKGTIIIERLGYDTNSDGIVNIIDLANIAKNYDTSKSDINWKEQYDYNCDGTIDIFDLVRISKKIS